MLEVYDARIPYLIEYLDLNHHYLIGHDHPMFSMAVLSNPWMFVLLAASLITFTTATGCNQDNCYRALSNRPSAATAFCHTFTTSTQPLPPKTATPTLPFTTQCADSPYRLSSACSCLVPAPTATCQPTPVLNQANNGGFDQIAIPEVGGTTEYMPPWYFDRMVNTRGDFIREADSSPYYGYGAAYVFPISTGMSVVILDEADDCASIQSMAHPRPPPTRPPKRRLPQHPPAHLLRPHLLRRSLGS